MCDSHSMSFLSLGKATSMSPASSARIKTSPKSPMRFVPLHKRLTAGFKSHQRFHSVPPAATNAASIVPTGSNWIEAFTTLALIRGTIVQNARSDHSESAANHTTPNPSRTSTLQGCCKAALLLCHGSVKDTTQELRATDVCIKDTDMPESLSEARFTRPGRENNIVRHAPAPPFTPIYMVCRGARKIAAERYRTRRRLHGLTERRFAARAMIRVPPRVRAQRPTSRVFLQRQGLDRLADNGHGRNRASRPRPMTKRVKSAAAASRLKRAGLPSPSHVGALLGHSKYTIGCEDIDHSSDHGLLICAKRRLLVGPKNDATAN